MSERRGTKALELWCRRITDGYPGVSVQNMTTSWRDGLAFCAMIHHFRPDLIDFNSLNKDDIFRNNELAFRIAEQHLGIPALLDAEDMASCSVPDRLSILTYLSQFYQVFGGQSPSKLMLNRTRTSSESSNERIGSVPESPQPKVGSRMGAASRGEQHRREAEDTSQPSTTPTAAAATTPALSGIARLRESCCSCGRPVYLAEKLVIDGSAYHRSCFRCARCRQQLTPGNYYETEAGQYCCEACPSDDSVMVADVSTFDGVELDQDQDDEEEVTDADGDRTHSPEPSLPSLLIPGEARLQLDVLEAPLSDEEKSKRQQEQQQQQQRVAADEAEFEHMIQLISERIEQLTTSPEGVSASTDEQKLAATGEPEAVETEEEPPVAPLRRSSSLRGSGKLAPPRRLSLGNGPPELRQEPLVLPTGPLPQLQVSQKKIEKVKKEEEDQEDDYPEELNPFASDNDVDEEEQKEIRRDERPPKKRDKPPSNNPFGSSSSDEEEQQVERRVSNAPSISRSGSVRRVLQAPRINLNPFEDDEDEDSESEPQLRRGTTARSSLQQPVPRPRIVRHSLMETGTLQPKSNLTSSSFHASNTSIASACSTMTLGTYNRKKKPAPPPPISPASRANAPSTHSLLATPPKNLNNSTSSPSPRLTPRARKSKPAPPPPLTAASSTTTLSSQMSVSVSEPTAASTPVQTPISKPTPQPRLWDDEKLSKEEANRNTKSLSSSATSQIEQQQTLDSRWKRKKGPAPQRPIPFRRKIKVMSMKDVKLELDQIEMQQQGLEKQGVRLEQIIRDRCETGNASEDTCLGLDVEELVLELFALVNEKNELFRRQAELMLLRRQQRLEEEHADIEYQVRCLISQPEATKTDCDKQREEALIQRLVEIVERRNEIVECLEMDRRREVEEDRSINREMDLYAARNKSENLTDESRRTLKSKKAKVKEKTKEKKSKKGSKKDADKDVDESESKHKRHSLRKWF
ncbi:hypothetical protein QAD02_022261 [Eretmocerus hayati]|uniref:Uncharacterized protein n=1 Tax=Eretmocerus hayati TaxID=131215 RepID=A0ACC2PST1_9HYME|nr:hypothetical protein QAD02_022261 [Eretmocerus hayati]